MKNIKEEDLYEPIKEYLEKNGYKVNGEVKDCDVTAVKNNELIIIEMKKSLNLTVLIQATDRQKMGDSVYVAIPTPKRIPRNWKKTEHLLKRLELGLIFVNFLQFGRKSIEVKFHPAEFNRKRNNKRRNSILREIESRTIDYNSGGSTGKAIMTAYKENAVFIACCLYKRGAMSAKELRKIGTGDKTYSILYKNFFGWYEKVDKGVYDIHINGEEGIKQYPELMEFYLSKIPEIEE